jgi:hypothetical protein
MAPPIAYQQASPPTRQKVIDFDCRGLEFTEFKPEVNALTTVFDAALTCVQGDWLATGIESGTKFEAISFEEGDWYEYDEKAGDEVSIKDLKWEIRKA